MADIEDLRDVALALPETAEGTDLPMPSYQQRPAELVELAWRTKPSKKLVTAHDVDTGGRR